MNPQVRRCPICYWGRRGINNSSAKNEMSWPTQKQQKQRLGLSPFFPGMMILKSSWMKPLSTLRRPLPCEPSAERPRK